MVSAEILGAKAPSAQGSLGRANAIVKRHTNELTKLRYNLVVTLIYEKKLCYEHTVRVAPAHADQQLLGILRV